MFSFDGDSKTINKVDQIHDELLEAQAYVIDNSNTFISVDK